MILVQTVYMYCTSIIALFLNDIEDICIMIILADTWHNISSAVKELNTYIIKYVYKCKQKSLKGITKCADQRIPDT